MDGGVSGSAPPFNFQRWRRQFAVAHLQDLVRDWQNPQPGPDEVLAAMRAAPVAPLQGEPFGVGMGALLEVDPGLVPRSRRRGPAGPEAPASSLESAAVNAQCACHNFDKPEVGEHEKAGEATNDYVTLSCDQFVLNEDGQCECRYEVIDSTKSCADCPKAPAGDYFFSSGSCGGKCYSTDFKQYIYDPSKPGCVPVYQCAGVTQGSAEDGGGKPCSATWTANFTVSCGSEVRDWQTETREPCFTWPSYDWGAMGDAVKGKLAGLAASLSGRDGDCTHERVVELQTAVTTACKGLRRGCKLTDDCDTLQSKLEINTKCRDARKAIEDECYGGGRERGHIQQLTDDANAVVKCQRFYDDKCR